MYRHQALEHTRRVSRGGIIRANRGEFWRSTQIFKIRISRSPRYGWKRREPANCTPFNGDDETNFERARSAKERREASVCCMSCIIVSLSVRVAHRWRWRQTHLAIAWIIPSGKKERARTRVILVLYIYIELPSNPSSVFLSRLPLERFRARLYFAAKLLKSRVVLPLYLRCACLFRFDVEFFFLCFLAFNLL